MVRSESAVAGFAEAMGRLAAVEHPSLPEVEAFDAEGPAPVVVARRPAGETLRARIDREQQLPPGMVASVWVSQVAAALSARCSSASARVLHRAISPEVVLLSGERLPGKLRLARRARHRGLRLRPRGDVLHAAGARAAVGARVPAR
ncbi:MAG: hypothetical protein R3A52_13355 [Polyangiales bacterium]